MANDQDIQTAEEEPDKNKIRLQKQDRDGENVGVGDESGSAKNQDSTQINSELNHISGSDVTIAGKNIINIRVDTTDQARDILKAIHEEESARQRPAPPPPGASLQEKVLHWFQHDLNTDDERFFVITLGMFNGLKYADFKDIYEIVLKVLKIGNENENEKKYKSYFAGSDGQLIEKSQAQIVRDIGGLEETLNYKDPKYEAAVFQLLREHYRNVLLDILPALKRIGEYSYWQIRSRAAEAVAEISKMGFHRVRVQVLEPWSRDSRAYVRAAVGYTLTRLYVDKSMQTAVNDLLKEWSKKDPPWANTDWAWRVRWTAASVYKQIGLENPELAYSGLKQIARHDDIRVADSVIHTLVVLSLQGQLENIILILGDWVAEGTGGKGYDQDREITCVVAILAFMVLSNIHVEVEEEKIDGESDNFTAKAGNLFDLVRLSAAKRGKIWDAVVGLGVRAFEYRLAENFFDLIGRWSEYSTKDTRLLDTICDLLAEVFETVKPSYRERLLNQLNRWERQVKNKSLANLAVFAKAEIKRRILS